jgi:hypothetical protein
MTTTETDDQKARAAARELARVLSVWQYGVDLSDSVDHASPAGGAHDSVKATEHHAGKPRLSKPKVKAAAPLGLNAVGKPFSPQYDPNYRLRYKPSYGHLRLPYPTTMRFVGDPPRKAERIRGHRRKSAPAPLFDVTPLERHDRRYPVGGGVTTVSPIVADRAQVDLINRLEEVRGLLETASAPEIARTLILADNALRAAVEFLVQLREERLGL